MADHLRIVAEHGLRTVAMVSCWSWRLQVFAQRGDAGIQAIWDLSHYHRNQDAVRCARIAAEAAYSINGEERLWLCPCERAVLYPMIAGLPRHNAPSTWRSRCPRSPATIHPAVGILTNDPITGVGERQFEATDAIVSAWMWTSSA